MSQTQLLDFWIPVHWWGQSRGCLAGQDDISWVASKDHSSGADTDLSSIQKRSQESLPGRSDIHGRRGSICPLQCQPLRLVYEAHQCSKLGQLSPLCYFIAVAAPLKQGCRGEDQTPGTALCCFKRASLSLLAYTRGE
ncbi:MAG: hypothetical protein FRX49_09779 [Trebouxia sp. A1-2]|nr:MAG: hypothetical protein FRX49_09779 [Trebouxia sp. A1-2]